MSAPPVLQDMFETGRANVVAAVINLKGSKKRASARETGRCPAKTQAEVSRRYLGLKEQICRAPFKGNPKAVQRMSSTCLTNWQ